MRKGKFALLLDGAFVIRKLEEILKRDATASDIMDFCRDEVLASNELRDFSLHRIHFYHASPFLGISRNPIDGKTIDFGKSHEKLKNEQIIHCLNLEDDISMRLGVVKCNGWTIGKRALENLLRHPRPLEARDLVPNLTQKGVDLRIGLDIARLTFKQTVEIIVVVTGDADLVPAFSFARREGMRVFLHPMGHGVDQELKFNVDRVMRGKPSASPSPSNDFSP